MAKFKVLKGRHIEGTKNRKEGDTRNYYKEGEVFESDRELDVIYPNKFERVSEPTTAAQKAEKNRVRAIKKNNPGDGEPANIRVSADEPLPDGNLKTQSGVRKINEDGDTEIASLDEYESEGVPASTTAEEEEEESADTAAEAEEEEEAPARAPAKAPKAGKTVKAKAGKAPKAGRTGKVRHKAG